eukprot:Skav215696  [mRNA]  locus=scaffold3538:77394:79339:+ [translate_table: standard]
MAAWKVSKLLALLAVLPWSLASVEDDDEEAAYSEAAAAHSEDATGSEDIGSSQTPSSVYVMEHGVLGDEWMPRGTIMLSGHGAGYEARLSDAKEISKAAGEEKYYAIRMYNPASPKRTLQAAIPMKLLADHFEDWHDILEVSVSDAGIPVALSYRVKHTLGLMLFDHTQVHLSEPSRIEGPRVQAAVRDADGSIKPAADQPQQQSFLRRSTGGSLPLLFCSCPAWVMMASREVAPLVEAEVAVAVAEVVEDEPERAMEGDAAREETGAA